MNQRLHKLCTNHSYYVTMNSLQSAHISITPPDLFDIPELTELQELPEEKFNLDEYISGNYDY